MHRAVIVSLVILVVLALSQLVYAEIYLFDDFESYAIGEALDAGDLWIKHQDATAPGEASDENSFPPGGKSGYFPGRSGIKLIPWKWNDRLFSFIKIGCWK